MFLEMKFLSEVWETGSPAVCPGFEEWRGTDKATVIGINRSKRDGEEAD
jgi:hypothetical protein